MSKHFCELSDLPEPDAGLRAGLVTAIFLRNCDMEEKSALHLMSRIMAGLIHRHGNTKGEPEIMPWLKQRVDSFMESHAAVIVRAQEIMNDGDITEPNAAVEQAQRELGMEPQA